METHKVLCRECGREGVIPLKAIRQRASCGICGAPMVVPTVEEEAAYREELNRQKEAEAIEQRRLEEAKSQARKRQKEMAAEAKQLRKEAKAQAARGRKEEKRRDEERQLQHAEERRRLEWEAREKQFQKEAKAEAEQEEISPAHKSAELGHNTKQVLGIIASVFDILGYFYDDLDT